MTLYCHVEEPSMKEVLRVLLPRLIAGRAEFEIIDHGSKDRLFKALPQRLRAYQSMSRAMPLGVLILVDQDDDRCHELKERLETMAAKKKMPTKSTPDHDGFFLVVNRIVIEELEAWFFGDLAAVCAAFPRFDHRIGSHKKFNDPDAIRGGTWERLHQEMKRVGYFKNYFPKIDVARTIAPYMNPASNRSKSFHAFKKGLEARLTRPAVMVST